MQHFTSRVDCTHFVAPRSTAVSPSSQQPRSWPVNPKKPKTYLCLAQESTDDKVRLCQSQHIDRKTFQYQA